MIVTIRNRGGDPNGKCRYEILVDSEPICMFKHDNSLGIPAMLDVAAMAMRQGLDNRSKKPTLKTVQPSAKPKPNPNKAAIPQRQKPAVVHPAWKSLG